MNAVLSHDSELLGYTGLAKTWANEELGILGRDYEL